MQGVGTGEVGLFIDLENIRYSFLNVYQIEPNISAFIDRAKRHGRVSVAMAYADFNEHPSWVRRALDVAGIAARDIPVRRFVRDGQDRVKSSADLHMLMDIMETALDRPQVQTYVLMTGDSDYIRVITWIKNRFDKRVIICGVPGTVSADLVAAAGEADHLEAEGAASPEALLSSIEAIALMMKRTVPPTGFWTVRLIDQWARDSRNGIPGSDTDKSNAISYMLKHGLMRRYKTVTDVREVTISELDETHAMVRQFVLNAGLPLDRIRAAVGAATSVTPSKRRRAPAAAPRWRPNPRRWTCSPLGAEVDSRGPAHTDRETVDGAPITARTCAGAGAARLGPGATL